MTPRFLFITTAFLLLSPTITWAQPKSIKTLDGKTYENFTLSSVSETTVKLMSPKGIFNVPVGHIKDEDLEAMNITADSEVVSKQREEIKYAIILEDVKKEMPSVTLIDGTSVPTSTINELTPINFSYSDDTGAKTVSLEDMSTDVKKAFGYDKAAAEAYKKKLADEQAKAAVQSIAGTTGSGVAAGNTAARNVSNLSKEQILARRSEIRNLLRDPKLTVDQRTKLNQEKVELDAQLRVVNAQ